jgi:hypothetical protein
MTDRDAAPRNTEQGGGAKKAHRVVAQVFAGLGLNMFPAIFIAIYARIAPIEEQGLLALSLAVGVYIAQLINAFFVEGALATPDADHDLCLPTWTALFCTVAAALLIVGAPVKHPAILMVSTTGLMSGLLVARTIGVVTDRWKQELAAATVLIAASLVALVLSHQHSEHCVRVLGAGTGAAILLRYWPRTATGRAGIPPDIRRSSWVTAETAVVGAVYPIITSLFLSLAGPAAAVSFRVIWSVAGALEPILAYGRYRLLAHGHRGEIGSIAAVFTAGLAAVLIAAFSGFGQLVFGPAWAGVGVTAVVFACLLKGLVLIDNVPFAALRKAGETALAFWVRAASSVLYLLLGVWFLLAFRSVSAVFLAFILAELFTIVLYHLVARKAAPDYGISLRRGNRSTGPASAIHLPDPRADER